MKKAIVLIVVAAVGLLTIPASTDVQTRTVHERGVTEELTNEPDPGFGSISGEITYNGVGACKSGGP